MNSQTVIAVILFSALYMVNSTRQEYNDLTPEESQFHVDQAAAASGHHGYGRVQIKVYRGPTEHHDHKHFAPHGYWVKQPADHHH